jgi:hypothetical protein
MERWHYAYAGLRVTSELLIPEWAAFEQPASFDDADVLIALGSTQTSEVSKTSEVWITADECRFHIPEAGDYWVHHGREIIVTPAPGAGAREIRLFLLGSAWGALCYQRGILAFHSSVVLAGDCAIAFCGETGSGKSSVAAWLIARGYRLVSDDLCRFEVAAGQARVYPSAPRLKLWRDALDVMGWSAEGLERDHFRMDKFHLDLTGFWKPVRSVPLPLCAIYLLEWGEPGIARLTGMTALRRLVAEATYRGELLEPMGQVAAHWQRCAELARHVPIWKFARPRDWAAFDAAMEMLIAHWQNTLDIVEQSW